MTPDYLTAFVKLVGSTSVGILVPLLTLMGLFALCVWVLFQAQKRDDFDASEFLRDDNRKLSWGRMGAFVCLMTHTWVVMTLTINSRLAWADMALYAVTWSGSLVLLEYLQLQAGKTPPGAPAPPAPGATP
jgi:hypothetical protein